jgi:hypothetical protein
MTPETEMVCNRSLRVWLLWPIVVPDQLDRKENAYPYSDASGVRYWTVLGSDLAHFAVTDSFFAMCTARSRWRRVDDQELPGLDRVVPAIVRWQGRTWQGGLEHLGLFMTWLAHVGAAGHECARSWPARGPRAKSPPASTAC